MTRGVTTSEDIVREYLTRLTRFDRNGPALRSMLALNPRALADARALRRRAGRRTRPRAVSRHPGRLQGQHRRARAADDRRFAGAGRAPAASRFAHGRGDARRRRGRPRQGEPRRVSVRRLRHQLGRRHDRERLRSIAQHRGLERRQRGRGVDQPGDARVRHRHLQLAVEPGGVRVAGNDSHDARADQPRRRDAIQSVQRRGRSDGEVGARGRARARSGCRRAIPRTR